MIPGKAAQTLPRRPLGGHWKWTWAKKEEQGRLPRQLSCALCSTFCSGIFSGYFWVRVKLSPRNNADTSASESRGEDPLERTPGHSKEGQEGVLGFSYSIPIGGASEAKQGTGCWDGQTKKVKVTEGHSSLDPSSSWIRRREKSTHVSLWAPRRRERGRLT